MADGKNMKREIIRRGAELIHARGYNATGLQEILEKSGVPKGSFYFYFRSKEDFGLEVIDYFASSIAGIFESYLRDASVPPLRRLERLFEFYESAFRKTGYSLGCPIGNLSLELGDAGERFRERLRGAIDVLVSRLESCLEEARRDGSLPGTGEVTDAARFIFHGFEGAILHMKVTRSIEPLRAFRRSIFGYLKQGAENRGTR